jgi:Flp pilus assembly protein TadG
MYGLSRQVHGLAKKEYKQSEKGQALILIVLAIIVLLGFTALAIDGGMALSDRRQAQNAADAAAMAGTLQKASGNTDEEARDAAKLSVATNGFSENAISTEVITRTNFMGSYILVTVNLTSTTETSFAHLVSDDSLTNRVSATGRVRISQPAIPGAAIVTLGNCVTDGGSLINIAGGGNSGGVLTYQGGIFLNTPETSANHCAIEPPNSAQTWGIKAMGGHEIWSVGSHDYDGEPDIDPTPINIRANGGNRISDPLSAVPEPICSSNGSIVGNEYQPGRYGGSGQPSLGSGTLAPGIYCITGSIHLAGNSTMQGNGVVLYFINGGYIFSGNGNLLISSPNVNNCLGTDGDPSASCTYRGMAIFMARNNTSTIEVRGNGESRIYGLVYGINGRMEGKGGGHEEHEWLVNGQVIVKTLGGYGNGSFVVRYNESYTYILPPNMSLER